MNDGYQELEHFKRDENTEYDKVNAQQKTGLFCEIPLYSP